MTALSNKCMDQDRANVAKWSTLLFFSGIVLGISLPKNQHLPSRSWQILSNIIGYTYFVAWSASFYPQVVMNYNRKTTLGLSVDFCALNILGYVCYATYTASFYWNPSVIEEYHGRGKGEITVQANDVAFA